MARLVIFIMLAVALAGAGTISNAIGGVKDSIQQKERIMLDIG